MRHNTGERSLVPSTTGSGDVAISADAIELFAAFLNEVTATSRQELMTVLDPSREFRPALITFVQGFMEKISLTESDKLYRLTAGESDRAPELDRMFYERAPAVVETILARFLENRMKAGRLRATDPIRSAHILISLSGGNGHQQMLIGGHPFDLENLHEDALQIVATDSLRSLGVRRRCGASFTARNDRLHNQAQGAARALGRAQESSDAYD